MRNTPFLAPLLLSICVSLLSACRYDDGPEISLRSAEKRVENTWVIDKVIDSGRDVTAEWQANDTLPKAIDFGPDTLAVYYYRQNLDPTKVKTGGYQLNNNKNNVVVKLATKIGNITKLRTITYEIRRLRNNEVWLRDNENDDFGATYVQLNLKPRN